VYVELTVDVFEVSFKGIEGDDQLLSHLLIGGARCKQAENTQLLGAERFNKLFPQGASGSDFGLAF
jgi:hypothetical protein